MVCAMVGTCRRRGFEPRFVRPSRGPLARSPPPPPSAPPSTIGTAGGWGACLVLVVFFLSSCPIHLSYVNAPVRNISTQCKKARHRAQYTYSSAPRHWYRRPPGAASPPRIPLGGFELPSSGQQPAVQPPQYEAQKPTHVHPYPSNTMSQSIHLTAEAGPPAPSHTQPSRLAASRPPWCPLRYTQTHTPPLKHTVPVGVTWPRIASKRKVTRVKDSSIRVPFSVL